ncbi:DUF2586 family protein [Chryseobacterium koreense]|uniref:Tail sheath protein C-terminal domain-containing protein n=1 Tax=Chryseobacterium koreense CCUG 49689 TaxID=1304281 RepID=A0A0J7IVC9_9FLAO|nr:DUF2586 family protein [Chryseobacterium koreense]KMQ70238.1 hypothetical protein ACM44_13370 [Chryseobacterium koreense CCUG 49689]MBB5334738.1 hypothetical protein [Chryseobacterium koreense]
MKPSIKIAFNNGVIGAVTPLDTGCFGFVASAVAVVGGFQLDTAYQLKSMKDVAELKLTDSIDNHRLFKTLTEFFDEAGQGTEVWIYGVAKTKKVSEWFTPTNGIAPVENLLNAAQGKIRGLFTVNDSSVAPVVTAGIDDDVLIAAGKAQTLFENYAAVKYAPFFTILEGYAFDGNKVNLPDLKTNNYNSVGILIGDSETRTGATASKGAAVGVLAGRLAAYPVRVNPGKVRNGSLNVQKLFVNDTPVENFDTEALYDKGYITFTTHQSRAGYFVMDDPLACAVDDDYHYLTRRRTINEAFRHSYTALLDFLLDEVPANNDGTIQAVYAKTIESAVVRRIANYMDGDLSRNVEDPKDSGVKCFVDLNQNIVTTSKMEVVVSIRPFGTNRWISVLLGFELTNQ